METKTIKQKVPSCFGTTDNVEECQGCPVIKECPESYKAENKW